MQAGRGRDVSQARPLRFGTSGLRALVDEMTDMECAINTRGFCGFLRASGQAGADGLVSLGGDRRASTPRIMAAVAQGVRDAGFEVDYVGLVPSPALALHAMGAGRPSIMVTGSHIPEDRNGIKFTRPGGEVLKRDEADILAAVARARAAEYALDVGASLFGPDGALKQPVRLPAARPDAELRYIERYVKGLPADCLAGMRIVLYEHSAVGRDAFAVLLRALGAEVVGVGRSETFVPVDTEKVSAATRGLLQELARAHRPFAIFSADGDSDRPLLADEHGRFLPGDKLGALAAMFLEADFAAVPISTNSAVVDALQARGVEVALTRIGSPYVIAAMNERQAARPDSRVCAWEANGGFLLGSPWPIEGGSELAALPTRDAVLPAMAALLLARREGLTLSQLIDLRLPPRHNTAGVVDDQTPGCEAYTAELGQAVVRAFSPQGCAVIRARFASDGALASVWDERRCPVQDPATLQGWRGELEAIHGRVTRALGSDDGFAPIETLDFTDGIRVTLAGGEVIHLRPSGNAPEFRVYAEAETAARAEAIVAFKDRLVPRILADL